MKGQRSKLSHVIVCDEANRWFYKQRTYKQTTIELGTPFIDTVPQIIRDYCEGMIFASQDCLSHTVMANTNLKIVGFLGDGNDIEAIAKSLDLKDDERSAITCLELGDWLVKKLPSRNGSTDTSRIGSDYDYSLWQLRPSIRRMFSRA